MKKQFKKAAAALNGAEKALKSWGIKYKKKPGGALVVPGNLDISGRRLTRLPDLSAVFVAGNFYCSDNRLTSLKGSPGAVGGDVHCQYNQLTSLKGGPAIVGGDYSCNRNRLASLEHGPASVGGHFTCSSNQLTSLKGAPATIGGNLYCLNNPLTSLEGAPKTCKELWSDAGTFSMSAAVPKHLLTSPETRARLAAEQEEKRERDIRNAVVLQNPVRLKAPFLLKKP